MKKVPGNSNYKLFYLFNLSILLGLFLPHNNFYFQTVHSLLPLILYVSFFKYNKLKSNRRLTVLFVITVILSFSLNVFITNKIEIKDIARMFSLVILFGLFPFMPSTQVSNKILYVSLLFIFLSQIAYVLNIGFLVGFFDRYYPYNGDVRGFSSEFLIQSSRDIESIVNRRYGGLYHNPNQAVRYITLLLSVFLIENKNKSLKVILPFIIVVYASLLLAGSRTGLIVGSLFVILYFTYLYKNKPNIKGVLNLLIIILILFFCINFIYDIPELRVFQLSKGLKGSLFTKVEWFFDFFNKLDSPLNFLIGHFSTNSTYDIYRVSLLDSEWGELFYSFGMLGFLILTLFYLNLFSTGDKNIRFYFIILLWGVSSTIIFSFRMSFLFLLFLSKYYSEYLLKNKNDKLFYF